LTADTNCGTKPDQRAWILHPLVPPHHPETCRRSREMSPTREPHPERDRQNQQNPLKEPGDGQKSINRGGVSDILGVWIL
jgi:hypothetical protein